MPKVKKGQSRDKLVLGPRRSPRIRAALHHASVPERNESKQRFSNASLSLLDLPGEILEQIIGNTNIWHHNRIRATCKRLKDVIDAFVMHEFRKVLARYVSEDPFSYESAVLKAVEQATEVYVRSGFQIVFCGCLLPLLRISYIDPFIPQHPYISKCLLHFYQMVESTIGDSTSQPSRFLYTLTLMRFLKAFKSFTVVSTCTLPRYWRTVIELKGPWLGMLWTRSQSQNLRSKQNHLLVTLTELLIGDISNEDFQHVWECDHEIYVYGNTSCTEKRVPRTMFTITIHGSKKISTLLSNCLYDDPKEFVWMEKWPRDQFTVIVDTCCNEAMKRGCSTSYHLELSPYENQTSSDDDIKSTEST